ncbi:alpha/beta fold hydrolase [Thalassotalea sp. ND16A]|uniref:alpha/beta fold hydrolase n=1 Tax=Thalassotalea sp. ND16A TaxID=1535422 RepID=UPI00051D91CE|nr:alpha/beta hydrolase [Thalassotalea sp. ND16A]KGJ88007.1 hypothetical protein ND16A_2560 [Thalassotalea sp. ND16A]
MKDYGVDSDAIVKQVIYATDLEGMDDKTKPEVLDWGGSGTPLVLLTGLALNAHTFDNFAPLFTGSYRVISISRVGHGNSDARKKDFSTSRLVKDIITVMKNKSIDSAIFSGHSFAGTELTYLGKHFPQKVRGLIYIDAVQALEYLPKVQESCPDVGQASIDSHGYAGKLAIIMNNWLSRTFATKSLEPDK